MPRPPIVFIPGFPASELRNANGTTFFPPPSLQTLADPVKKKKFIETITDLNQLTAGPPILHVLQIAKQAQSLYDILTSYGYSIANAAEFAPIGWDWRRAVDDPIVLGAVERAIDAFVSAGAKPVVMIHSTGGLVLRRLLELRPAVIAKIAQIVAFAVPWAGTLKSFVYLSNGERFGFLQASLDPHEAREVMSWAQAAYDLLPPPAAGADVPPALAFDTNGRVSPLVNTTWTSWSATPARLIANAANAAARMSRTREILPGSALPPMVNLVGFGVETLSRADISAGGGVTFQTSKDGDGTVLLTSAQWIAKTNVRTFYVPIGVYATNQIPTYHSAIWDAPSLVPVFDQIVKGKTPQPFVAAAIDNDDASNGGQNGLRIYVSAADANGQPLPNATISFQGLQTNQSFPLNQVRSTVFVPQNVLPPFTSSMLVRFTANIEWGVAGAKQKRALVLIFQR